MTIPEEIEQLKIKLNQTADEREQGLILVEILKNYTSINSTESQPYIDRLLLLADKLHESLYKAWGLINSANLSRLKGDYNAAIDISKQSLTLFQQENCQQGISHCYNSIGIVNMYQGNYPEAMENHFISLKLWEETCDKQGIANSYQNIGLIYYYQGNYSEALKNYFAALKLNEQIENKFSIAKTYSNIGLVYDHQGNYPEALKNNFAGLKLREEIEDKSGIASTYNNIGQIYYKQGNYPEALKNHFSSLKLKKEIGDKRGIAGSHNNIGNIYSIQGNYPEALKSHSTSFKLSEEIGDKLGICTSYINLGNVCYLRGDYQEALKNDFASLKLSEEMGNKNSIATSYGNIGNNYDRQGNYPEALKNYFTELKLREEMEDKAGIASSCNNIGQIYYEQGNYPEALKEQLRALQMAEEIGNKEITKDTLFSLFDIYKKQRNFENALKHHENYHRVESEMLGEQSQKQLTNLNFQHNMEQKEKDLEIEQLRNVELKKERDRSETLLLNILPAEVAEELKNKGTADAKLFDNVTVLFTDFKSFTTVSEKLSPQQLVDELNTCFSAFDEVMGKYNIEKIKTVGDAYLAVSGLPLANPNHANDMVKAAIEIRDFMTKRKLETLNSKLETFEVRIGVHSGSVVAGIVGIKKFAYDIWGDTVNTAARMEQNSEAGKINISQTTYDLVKDKFNCKYRGEIEAKNKGKLKMYFIGN